MTRRYQDMIDNEHGWSNLVVNTPSSASSSTRRTQQRRMKRAAARVASIQRFQREYRHFQYIEMSAAYCKLDQVLMIATHDEYVKQFTETLPAPLGDYQPNDYHFVVRNTLTEMNHLKRFCRPARHVDPAVKEVLKIASEHVLQLMMVPTLLHFPTKDMLESVSFEGPKFAGIDYAKMGLKTRAKADGLAQCDAEVVWDRFMEGKHVLPHDMRMGGRGILTTNSKLDSETTGMILMMSQRDLKLAGVTENMLTDIYSAPKYPVPLGTTWWHGGCDEFLKRWIGYDRYYCLDAKKSDADIDPWMVRWAIGILRSQYVDGHYGMYDAYWEFIYEGLVEPVIFRDDGLRFKKFVGITPGHSYSTLIQSIITLMIGYAGVLLAFSNLDPEIVLANTHIESLGDDILIGIKNLGHGPSVEELSESVQNGFGIDWSGEKSFSTTILLDTIEGEFQGIQFLGKFFRLSMPQECGNEAPFAIPYRPAEETYMNLYFPESSRRTVTHAYKRALGNLYDCSGNSAMQEWMIAYVTWLRGRVNEIEHIWPDDGRKWLVRASAQGTRSMVPECKLVSKVDWLQLVRK